MHIEIKNPKFRKSLSFDKKNLKERFKIMYDETFFTSPPGSSANVIFQAKKFLKGNTVLDLGCGSGRVSLYASKYAKHVTGIDYIENAIKYSQKFSKLCNIKNVEFHVGDLDTLDNTKYDVILMNEVLQHVDNPKNTMKKCNHLLKKGGFLIISMPSFNNFRGYVWMTLQTLFHLPMSLTDIHKISADDMQKIAKNSGFKIEKMIGTAWDWAWSEWAIDDLKRRIFLAAKDAKIDKSADFKSINNWLDSNLLFNKQFLDSLISKKILKKRPQTNLLQIPKNTNSKVKKYLDDGNSKKNLFYCDVSPFNRMGEGIIYILKKT